MRSAAAAALRRRLVMPRLGHADLWLLLPAAALVAFGIVAVLNTSYFYAEDQFRDPFYFVHRHLAAVAIGSAALVSLSRVRLEVVQKLAGPVLLGCIALLVLVLMSRGGVEHGGARRWLGVGPFRLQPAEFARGALVAYLADSMARKGERMATVTFGILPHVLAAGVCSALLIAQPDFGSAVLAWAVTLLMLFVGGARLRHLAGIGAMACAAGSAALVFSHYRAARIAAYWELWQHCRDSAFQLCQSLIAFGSGGWLGSGLGTSKQKMFFLPEAHNDFIFAIVGEELGLIGALAVVAAFGWLGVRGFRIALRHPDPFGSLLAFGITANLLLGAAIHMGVVLGLLPTKGLPLPFVSAGGSAMVATLAQIGLLAGLSRSTG